MPLAFAAQSTETTCSLSVSIAHFSFLTHFIIIFKACVVQTKSSTSRWSQSSPVLGLEKLPALFFIVNDRRMERLDGTRRRPNPCCSSPPTHAGCFLGVFSLQCPPELGERVRCSLLLAAPRGELRPRFAEVVPVPRAPGDSDGATPVNLGVRLKHIEGPILAHPCAPANLRGGWHGPGFDAGPEPGRGPASGTPHPALVVLLLPRLNKFFILPTFNHNRSSPVDHIY